MPDKASILKVMVYNAKVILKDHDKYTAVKVETKYNPVYELEVLKAYYECVGSWRHLDYGAFNIRKRIVKYYSDKPVECITGIIRKGSSAEVRLLLNIKKVNEVKTQIVVIEKWKLERLRDIIETMIKDEKVKEYIMSLLSEVI